LKGGRGEKGGDGEGKGMKKRKKRAKEDTFPIRRTGRKEPWERLCLWGEKTIC